MWAGTPMLAYEHVILGIAARGGEIAPDLVGARPRDPTSATFT